MNSITRARKVLPQSRMLQHIGMGVLVAKNVECPSCHRKKFGVIEFKEHGGNWHFKCHSSDCIASDPDGGHNEIGFLVLLKGLSGKDAKEFLRLATEVEHVKEFENLPQEVGKDEN